MVHRASGNTRLASCVYVYTYYVYIACDCVWVEFGIRKKDEKSTTKTRGECRGEERQGETQRKKGKEKERRDVAKQRPSPISILIELNATSYLMPETRQKLQLNGNAISLYLPVHSS